MTKSLFDQINQVANVIHQKCLRGVADHIIVSPQAKEEFDILVEEEKRRKNIRQRRIKIEKIIKKIKTNYDN